MDVIIIPSSLSDFYPQISHKQMYLNSAMKLSLFSYAEEQVGETNKISKTAFHVSECLTC